MDPYSQSARYHLPTPEDRAADLRLYNEAMRQYQMAVADAEMYYNPRPQRPTKPQWMQAQEFAEAEAASRAWHAARARGEKRPGFHPRFPSDTNNNTSTTGTMRAQAQEFAEAEAASRAWREARERGEKPPGYHPRFPSDNNTPTTGTRFAAARLAEARAEAEAEAAAEAQAEAEARWREQQRKQYHDDMESLNQLANHGFLQPEQFRPQMPLFMQEEQAARDRQLYPSRPLYGNGQNPKQR